MGRTTIQSGLKEKSSSESAIYASVNQLYLRILHIDMRTMVSCLQTQGQLKVR